MSRDKPPQRPVDSSREWKFAHTHRAGPILAQYTQPVIPKPAPRYPYFSKKSLFRSPYQPMYLLHFTSCYTDEHGANLPCF